MEVAYSIGGVPIRLTEERWSHIVENHDEMLDRADDVLQVVAAPEWITRGNAGPSLRGAGLGASASYAFTTRKSRRMTVSLSRPT